MNKHFEKIHVRLIGLSVLLILLTALPIGLITDNIVQSALMNRYMNTSVEQLTAVDEAVKIFQGDIDNDLRMFANHPLILKADDTITKYTTVKDKVNMTPSKNGGIEQEIYEVFEHYAKYHPGTLYLSIGTETGGFIQWPESSTVKYDPRERPWYVAALGGGDQVSRTLPYADSVTGDMVVSNGTPIRTADGKLIGAMTSTASSAKIADLLQAIKIGETGYCMMIHKSGLVIADPSNLQNNGKYIKDMGIEGFGEILDSNQLRTELVINGKDYFAFSFWSDASEYILVSLITAEELYQTARNIRLSIISVGVLILLIAGILSYFGSRQISKPITAISSVAQNIADGNLRVNVPQRNSKGEIGVLENSIERMITSLRQMIRSTSEAAERLAASAQVFTANSEQSVTAANHIATAISKVVAGTDEEMARATETALVVEQMSACTQETAASVNQVAMQSAQAVDKAKGGGKTVGKAISQMSQIEATVGSSAQAVIMLGERSKEIGQIVDTISGIAGQTNLLALNAAIEAARAGELGKGFAVVAEEVRKLAEQSGEAAKKIEHLIGEIQVDTEKAVIAMNEGTREVRKGIEAVDDAGAAFREITDLVAEISNQVKDISAAIQQTAAGNQQIVDAVKTIDGLSKRSAGEAKNVSAATDEQLASMEEIVGSSQSLVKLAEEMQTVVRRFKI